MSKDKNRKNYAEIYLKQANDIGFSIKTSGSVEQIGNAILTLHAWFISEYIDKEKVADYLLYCMNSLKRKSNKETIQCVEVDLDELMKQMGGKDNG